MSEEKMMTIIPANHLHQPLLDIIADYVVDEEYPEILEYKGLSFVKWYYRIKRISRDEFMLTYRHIFNTLNIEDHLEITKWLVTRFELDESDCIFQNISLLEYAIKHNCVKSIRWLFRKFDGVRRDYSSDIYFAQCAIKHDKLEIFKLIHKKFKLTKDSEIYRGTNIFEFICSYDRLDMAKWMVKELKMTREDCMIYDNLPFYRACMRGNYKTARWLVDRFRMTKEECINKRDFVDIIILLCEYDHPEFIKWLVRRFKITKNEFLVDDGAAVSYMCSFKRIKLIKWTIIRFNLSRDEFLYRNTPIRNLFYENLPLANWLKRRYGDDIESYFPRQFQLDL